MKLLFVNLNHIGDMLFTLPAADLVRSAHPNAEIVNLVSEMTFPLVQHDPRFTEVIPRSKSNVREWAAIAIRLRRRHRFDAAVNFCRNSPGLGLVTWLSGAPLRIGFSGAWDTQLFFNRCIAYDDALHRVERNTALLEPLGIVPWPAPPMRLHLPEALKAEGEGILRDAFPQGRCIALCVGASVERKKWPLQRFITLAQQIQSKLGPEVHFALIGGAEDAEDAERLISDARVSALSLCGKLNLTQSAAVLHACDLVIGGDTGPLQLAITVDVPVVALFGATEPRRTGPYQAHGEMLFHRLPCCGCSNSVPCPIQYQCMAEITVEEATQAALRVLENRPQTLIPLTA